MPEATLVSNAESRARLAFRHLTNGLYLKQSVDVKPYMEGFLTSITDGVSDLFCMELCAMWGRLKPHYEQLQDDKTAATIEQKLRDGAARYLGLPQ